ncbi:HipA family kinase [Leptolyngbya sp. AN03gr2]|uniref:HipA family kinase n=1 Tax=unclassified Leptolyngbya TaxID=2650499 RepID=UPI003D31F046
MNLRTVTATRYITTLREGGSLPAIVEADDDGMYVLKFRGAGQGAESLIAKLIAGEMARALGLPMPEIVFVDLNPDLARTEPDPEIQDLIRASAGLNLAIDYLPGSVTFDPIAGKVDAELASKIVWFDAYITNVDRTARKGDFDPVCGWESGCRDRAIATARSLSLARCSPQYDHSNLTSSHGIVRGLSRRSRTFARSNGASIPNHDCSISA